MQKNAFLKTSDIPDYNYATSTGCKRQEHCKEIITIIIVITKATAKISSPLMILKSLERLDADAPPAVVGGAQEAACGCASSTPQLSSSSALPSISSSSP